MLGSGGPEFNVIVCRRSNVEPVCWTHTSTSGAASTAAPPTKTFYITHAGGQKHTVGSSGSLFLTNGRHVALSTGEQKATADYQ